MRILKLKEVMNRTALGRSTLYHLLKNSCFPKPVPLGPRAVGWLESEVEGWIIGRVKERDTLTK